MEILVLVGGGKSENPEKNLPSKATNNNNWTRPIYGIGGSRALSPHWTLGTTYRAAKIYTSRYLSKFYFAAKHTLMNHAYRYVINIRHVLIIH